MTEQGSANHLEESNNNETVKTINIKGYCEHGRRKSRCKDCGGSGICSHGRIKTHCKDCGGSGICEHGRQRTRCKDCGGSGICSHGRVKSQCKECGGRGSNKVPRGEKRKLDNRIDNINKELILLKDIPVRSNLVLVGTKMLLLLQYCFKC